MKKGGFRKNGEEAGGERASVTCELLGFCIRLNGPALERLASWGLGRVTCHCCGTFETWGCEKGPWDGTLCLCVASLEQKRRGRVKAAGLARVSWHFYGHSSNERMAKRDAAE